MKYIYWGNITSGKISELITRKKNVRENRRGNQKWTIQSHWEHILGTQDTLRRQAQQNNNPES